MSAKSFKPMFPTNYELLAFEGKLAGALQRDIIALIHLETTLSDAEWYRVSFSKIAERCRSDLRGCQKAVKDLLDRGIIERRDYGNGRTGVKGYKLAPENWASAPPYVSLAAQRAVANA